MNNKLIEKKRILLIPPKSCPVLSVDGATITGSVLGVLGVVVARPLTTPELLNSCSHNNNFRR